MHQYSNKPVHQFAAALAAALNGEIYMPHGEPFYWAAHVKVGDAILYIKPANGGRYEISLSADKLPNNFTISTPSCHVAATRSPADVARDVTRKLLKAAPDWHAAIDAARAKEQARADSLAAAKAAFLASYPAAAIYHEDRASFSFTIYHPEGTVSGVVFADGRVSIDRLPLLTTAQAQRVIEVAHG